MSVEDGAAKDIPVPGPREERFAFVGRAGKLGERFQAEDGDVIGQSRGQSQLLKVEVA